MERGIPVCRAGGQRVDFPPFVKGNHSRLLFIQPRSSDGFTVVEQYFYVGPTYQVLNERIDHMIVCGHTIRINKEARAAPAAAGKPQGPY